MASYEIVSTGFRRLYRASIYGLALGLILYIVIAATAGYAASKLGRSFTGIYVFNIQWSWLELERIYSENPNQVEGAIVAVMAYSTRLFGSATIYAIVIYLLLVARGLRDLSKVSRSWRIPAWIALIASIVAIVSTVISTALLYYVFSDTLSALQREDGFLRPSELSSTASIAMTIAYASCFACLAVLGYTCFRIFNDMNIWQCIVGYAYIIVGTIVLRDVGLLTLGLPSFGLFSSMLNAGWIFGLITATGWIIMAWGFNHPESLLGDEIIVEGDPPKAMIVYKKRFEERSTHLTHGSESLEQRNN